MFAIQASRFPSGFSPTPVIVSPSAETAQAWRNFQSVKSRPNSVSSTVLSG